MSKSTDWTIESADDDGDAETDGEQPTDRLDRVAEDPDLLPVEKETTIRFDKTTDTATWFTAEAGLMRRLLQHPRAEVTETVEHAGEIHGVKATLPVGCLTASLAPRSSGGHAEVVTRRVLTPDDGEG